MKPGHRSGKVRRGLGDPPDVEDHRCAVCFEGPSECALGDSSGAPDPHARCPQFIARDRTNANRTDVLLTALLCRHSIVDTPIQAVNDLPHFPGFSPTETLHLEKPALHGKQHSAEGYCVGDVGEGRHARARARIDRPRHLQEARRCRADAGIAWAQLPARSPQGQVRRLRDQRQCRRLLEGHRVTGG